MLHLYILHLYTFAFPSTAVLATDLGNLVLQTIRLGRAHSIFFQSCSLYHNLAALLSSFPLHLLPSVGAIMVYARYPGHLFPHDFM
jgi:hypothetical protein